MQTAEILARGADVITDERLIEMDYGPYEGSDLRQPAPELAEFFRDFVHNTAPRGMEPLSEIVRRTGEFLEEIHDYALTHDVLLSTHAIAMKGALEYLTPQSEGSYWKKFIGNCSVYSARALDDGTWTVPKAIIEGAGRAPSAR